ncbi:MFS transporter [Streptomyces vinaceus]|uniref:MFS transporter n=1 Tax=Streptomyces vinaceus TaxID=1960 RepID=UPI003820E9B2
MAASNFVYTVGSGLHLTAGVLYFTQAVHLPAPQVGLGLGVAGLLSLAVGIAVGHLADRRGARGIYAATLVVQALATAGFVLADSFRPFVVAAFAATGAKGAGLAARSPIIRRHGGDRPQEFRAHLRAVTNIGISIGAVLAGWVVQVGTHSAYRLMVVGNALAFAASALAYRRSGFAFLLACVLISLTQDIPGCAAATLLLAGVAVHTIGELWHAAAGFEVSFALAPERATGPAAPFVVRWAERQRPAEQVQFDGGKTRSTATA